MAPQWQLPGYFIGLSPFKAAPVKAIPVVAMPNVAMPNVAMPNVAMPNVAIPVVTKSLTDSCQALSNPGQNSMR